MAKQKEKQAISLDTKYNKKLKIPKFEPNDDNVELTDCVYVDKYVELLTYINGKLKSKSITELEAKFLKLCATRWLKFDYENVAQYYATKASPEFQRCLEKEAMILVDIDKAMENSIVACKGYVAKLEDIFQKDNLERFDERIDVGEM